jgi:hypothetical protein
VAPCKIAFLVFHIVLENTQRWEIKAAVRWLAILMVVARYSSNAYCHLELILPKRNCSQPMLYCCSQKAIAEIVAGAPRQPEVGARIPVVDGNQPVSPALMVSIMSSGVEIFLREL